MSNWITGLSLWKYTGLIYDAQRYVGHGSICQFGMAIAGGVAQLCYQGISNQHEPHIVRCGWWYNSLRPNHAYVSHQPRPSLLQISHCQLDHYKQTSVKLYLKFKHIHSRKCIWKCRLEIVGHYVTASMCLSSSSEARSFTVQGVLDGLPSRDAGFRLFGWLDGISSTLPYYHSPKHTFQSVNFPTKYGGFFDIFPSIYGGYSHPIHMLKSLKKMKN